MKLIACRSGMTLVLFSLGLAATDATAAAMEQGGVVELNAVAAGPPAGQAAVPESRVFFATGEEANELTRSMKLRWADPQQRATLRSEQRASVQEQHPEVGQVLGLDPATEHKLIELLTDQQMSQLERMYSGARPDFDSYREAQVMTQHLAALRELLGEDRLDRFQDYQTTLLERGRVGIFSAHLSAGNALRPDQKERLIALHYEQALRERSTVRRPSRMMLRSFQPGSQLPSREEMQKESQLNTIAANEAYWRLKQQKNREIEKRSAAFLAPAQLAALSKLHAEDQDSLRRWIQSARIQAGMNPEIPEQAAADDSEDPGKPIDGQVQVEIHMTIDRGEPTVVTQTVRNGESFTFAAADGLIAEVTPTLYDGHWLNLQINYYEQRAAGRHPIQGGGAFGIQTRMPDGTPNSHGGGSTLVSGRKVYVIETMANATAQ